MADAKQQGGSHMAASPGKALVVGGTGPSGPHLIAGLLDRGFDVSIFHRGVHEPAGLPDVEHIHGDPHFEETIRDALNARRFDLVLATYGRVRYLARALAGRCDRFISIGGGPGYQGQQEPERVFPFGMKAVLSEDDPLVEDTDESIAGYRIARTEKEVFRLHEAGALRATLIRYPQVYGPRQNSPRQWSIVKRILDGRTQIIVPDGGLVIRSRSSARNAAHSVLLAIDDPDSANGQIYNCAEDDQFTIRQWYEMTARCAGGELEIVSLPEEIARSFHAVARPRNHMVFNTEKIRRELGYRDVIAAKEALQETVDWLLENPPDEQTLEGFPDPFDYESEDRVIRAYRRSMIDLQALTPPPKPAHSSYAHPKQPHRPTDSDRKPRANF